MTETQERQGIRKRQRDTERLKTTEGPERQRE